MTTDIVASKGEIRVADEKLIMVCMVRLPGRRSLNRVL